MSTVKVLIVDDSNLMRKLLSSIVAKDSRLHVVGTAENGADALEKIKQLQPDVVTLDMNMPVMDGLTTLREANNQKLGPAFLIVSSLAQKDAQITIDAINEGALDYIPKPSQMMGMAALESEIISKIVMCYEAKRRDSGQQTEAGAVLGSNGLRPVPVSSGGSGPGSVRSGGGPGLRPAGAGAGGSNPGAVRPATPGGSDPGVVRPVSPGGSNPGAVRPVAPGGSNPGAVRPATPGGSDPGEVRPGRPGSNPGAVRAGSAATPGPGAVRPGAASQAAQATASVPITPGARPKMMIFGGSAGSMQVLQKIIPHVPATFSGVAVFVLHLPAFFTAQLALKLRSVCRVPVEEAKDGMPIALRRIYIAPGGSQNLTVLRNPHGKGVIFRLVENDRGGPTPSIDAFMISAADIFRDACRGILISGTGTDGIDGLRRIRERLGDAYAQDKASTLASQLVVEALEKGVAERSLQVADIISLFG